MIFLTSDKVIVVQLLKMQRILKLKSKDNTKMTQNSSLLAVRWGLCQLVRDMLVPCLCCFSPPFRVVM